MSAALPQDAASRKAAPMAEGLLYYFPNALAEVARVSKAGNDQHNPGQPMHHARGKSMDHADCIIRHLVDAGTVDSDGQRHSAKVAWRALALLQEELEREEGCPVARNARTDQPKPDAYREALSSIGVITHESPPKWSPAWGLGTTGFPAPKRHPMQAEAIRDHDERLSGPEDVL